MNPIVEEAAKKAAVAWLTVAGAGPAYLVWCLWIDDALYVVTGPGEQPAPGLTAATTATVTLRGDHGGRVVTWVADVSVADSSGPAWGSVASALAAKRLNAPGGPQLTAARWVGDCAIVRLAPAGEPAEAGSSLPDSSLAAPAPPTPAARRTRRPFHLHRVRRP